MEARSLWEYLSAGKKNVSKIPQFDVVYVVMGNEGCDLDSVISSIVIGYYTAYSMSKEEKASTTVFTVVNCKREDLPLRTESVFYLKENGVDIDQVVCLDDIDLHGLHDLGKLKLILVDHNLLTSSQARLDSSVTRVIDHHKLERQLKPGDVIQTVGSCTTHVGDIVLHVFTHDPTVCALLYGRILVDTQNFSEVTNLGTPKDIRVFHELERALISAGKTPNRKEIFGQIWKARSDCSQLTPDQILRKDTKIITSSKMAVSIPSVPMGSTQFLKILNMFDAIIAHNLKNHVEAVVILCNENDNVEKGCIIYSDHHNYASQICNALENSELELTLVKTIALNTGTHLFVYDQGNPHLNRKYYAPLLENEFCEKSA